MQIMVRDRRRPTPPAPVAAPAAAPAPPGYDITRRVGDRSVVLGRVAPRERGKSAYGFANGGYFHLGDYPDAYEAFLAVVAAAPK